MLTLTLSGPSLGDPLSDYPAGVVDSCGGLVLHCLHDVALANADFERQRHHLGNLCGWGLQLHLYMREREGTERGRGEFFGFRGFTVVDFDK